MSAGKPDKQAKPRETRAICDANYLYQFITCALLHRSDGHFRFHSHQISTASAFTTHTPKHNSVYLPQLREFSLQIVVFCGLIQSCNSTVTCGRKMMVCLQVLFLTVMVGMALSACVSAVGCRMMDQYDTATCWPCLDMRLVCILLCKSSMYSLWQPKI